MKTVVITGVSKGIGLATAQKFLTEGWRVIGTFLHTPVILDDPNFVAVPLDLASAASIETAAGDITRQAQRLDAIVNNAAVLVDYEDTAANLDRIRQTFAVNLFGTIDFTERLLPTLGGGGHIVNIDSGLGSFSDSVEETGMLGYRMSKASLNMYTRVLAFRLKERGILVSSLDPGWVNTDMGRVGGETPTREPEKPAVDIYSLVTAVTDIADSGSFWRDGEKRPW